MPENNLLTIKICTMKKTITTICSLFLIAAAIAQTPTWTWAKTADGGGTLSDGGIATTTDMDGNIYTLGFYQSPTITFGSTVLSKATTNTAVPVNDLVLVKYDAGGNVLWAKAASGSFGDIGYALDTDANGNIYIAGSTTSTMLTMGTVTISRSQTGEDFFLAKADKNGNFLWIVSPFGNQQDQARGVAVDNAGNVIIAGFSGSDTLKIGNTKLYNTGPYGNLPFIAKYDPDGNPIWAKQGFGNAVPMGVDVDMNTNEIYMAGHYYSNALAFGSNTLTNTKVANPPIGNSQGDDLFLVKYDANGNAIWARTATGAEDEIPTSVAVATSYNPYYPSAVYLGGYFTSTTLTAGGVTFTTSSQLQEGFLLKFDALNGDVKWGTAIGGTGRDYLKSIALVGSGGVVAAGYFNSATLSSGTISVTKNGPTDNYDVFAAAFNSNGSPVMITTAGGSENDRAEGISVDKAFNVYVTGDYSSNPITFGSIALANKGEPDLYTAQLSSPEFAKMGTVGVAEHSLVNWIFSPNPTNGFVNFSAEKTAGNTTINVYNMTGQKVLQQNFNEGSNLRINLSDLPSGVYNLSVNTGNAIATTKIIKN
jgi:hypothetical protein